MGMRPLVRNQANKHPCTQTIELWARRSCSPLDFGNKPINKHLASDVEDQTKWLALIDKNVLSASLQLGWRVRLALIRRSYPGHSVSSKQETSGSSCTSRLIMFEEHPSDTQRVPYGVPSGTGAFFHRKPYPPRGGAARPLCGKNSAAGRGSNFACDTRR